MASFKSSPLRENAKLREQQNTETTKYQNRKNSNATSHQSLVFSMFTFCTGQNWVDNGLCVNNGGYALTFIHSFITEIYIAPLQGYYSEALPTLARLKRRVLRVDQKGRVEGRVECVRKNPGD